MQLLIIDEFLLLNLNKYIKENVFMIWFLIYFFFDNNILIKGLLVYFYFYCIFRNIIKENILGKL